MMGKLWKKSYQCLKKEILKVKEEIDHLNYDTTQDDAQAKQCEIEIEKLQLIAKNFDFKTRIKNLPLEDMEKYPPSCNYS